MITNIPTLTNNSTTYKTNYLVLAYMKDTIWIATSKEELSEIITTATTFYNLTNIQINPTKSVLATNITKTTPSIIFNNTSITSIPTKEAFRFLGCWFTIGKRQSPIHQIIMEEATNTIKKLKYAKITEKQAIYIINSVILTRIA